MAKINFGGTIEDVVTREEFPMVPAGAGVAEVLLEIPKK